MIIEVFSYIIVIIGLIVIAIDLIPIINDWLGRIRIGRYTDLAVWNHSITNIAMKWLNRTPKIKVTDHTRLVVIDILKGNYTKRAIQYWQEASLVLGLSEYLQYNDNKEVRYKIKKFLNSKFDFNGHWRDKPRHVDAAILAYSIMKLDFIDTDQYKNALDHTWELIKEHIGEDGTVQYRKSMRSYQYVDTIGFICPFLVAYGTKYNQVECIDLAMKQIQEYEKYGMLENHHIPSHAYKLDNKAPLGLYGWGRGLGWFAIGLIDAWNGLPQDHKHKLNLEQSVKKFAKAVIGFQQANGNWNWTVTREESRPDSSATVTLGWFLLNASKIDELSQECLEHADKAMGYLMKVTRRNGAVDFSQGDTKDIGVYSMLFNTLPFTQGFCVRCMNLYTHMQVERGF